MNRLATIAVALLLIGGGCVAAPQQSVADNQLIRCKELADLALEGLPLPEDIATRTMRSTYDPDQETCVMDVTVEIFFQGRWNTLRYIMDTETKETLYAWSDSFAYLSDEDLKKGGDMMVREDEYNAAVFRYFGG